MNPHYLDFRVKKTTIINVHVNCLVKCLFNKNGAYIRGLWPYRGQFNCTGEVTLT